MSDEIKNTNEPLFDESVSAAEIAEGNFFQRTWKKIVNHFKEKREKRKSDFAHFKTLSGKEKAKSIFQWFLNHALYILIGIFVLVVFIYNTNFLSFDSIVNITMQSAARLIMALGIAGAIVLTGTDLSAGRSVGLCACICASLLQSSGVVNKMFPGLTYSVWLIPVALLISMLVGAL